MFATHLTVGDAVKLFVHPFEESVLGSLLAVTHGGKDDTEVCRVPWFH